MLGDPPPGLWPWHELTPWAWVSEDLAQHPFSCRCLHCIPKKEKSMCNKSDVVCKSEQRFELVDNRISSFSAEKEKPTGEMN